MRTLYSFEKDRLLRSGRLIVPLVLLIGYIGIAYAIGPLDILSSFSIGALVVFILALSVGIMDAGLSSPMIEQAMWVKLHKKLPYYIARPCLMAALAVALALISVAGPLLIHYLSGAALFKRPVTPADVLTGFIMFWLAAYSGGMSGLFASPRLIRSRRTAILSGAAFGVLTIVKGALVSKAVWLVWILWVLPPIFDMTSVYSAQHVVNLGAVCPYYLWMAAYAAAETVIYAWLMARRRFE